MKKQIFYFLFIISFPVILFAQNKVTIVEDSLYSKSVNSYMRFNVILPVNYSANQERYPALYLLHGYTGNQDDWVTRTGIVEYLKNYDFIIITPDGKNSWYTNSPVSKNKNFEDYIIKELIPIIESKYRVLSTRHGRAIAGLSMGGYGAVKLALKYPGTFYYSASFSGAINFVGDIDNIIKSSGKSRVFDLVEAFGETKGAHRDNNDPFILLDSLKTNQVPYFYISVGKDDGIAGLVEGNRSFVEKMRKKGLLYEYHELPGVHNWVFWDKEILEVLRKLAKFDALR